MLNALKTIWEERSDNFYENYLKIKLFLLTLQYVAATGDYSVIESLYGTQDV